MVPDHGTEMWIKSINIGKSEWWPFILDDFVLYKYTMYNIGDILIMNKNSYINV